MDLKALAEKRLNTIRVGQSVGHHVGQSSQEVSHTPSHCPTPLGQQIPQISANFGDCPIVPPLKSRDSGTAPVYARKSGTPVGTAGGTLRFWRSAISSLNAKATRGGYDEARWHQLLRDCARVLEFADDVALNAGWTAEDLFGVDPAGAGGSIVGGLAWRLEGRKLLSVEAGVATFQYRNGEIGRCSRGWVRGLVPVWDLGE